MTSKGQRGSEKSDLLHLLKIQSTNQINGADFKYNNRISMKQFFLTL